MLARAQGRNFLERPNGGGLSSPVAAADVKHRYQVGGWRTVNKPIGAGTVNLTMYGADLTWVPNRAVNVVRFSMANGTVVVAGSAILVEISVNGGVGWATLGTLDVGQSVKSAAATGAPIAVADGADVRVRVTTDASYSSANADPQVWIEVEEQ